MIAFSVLAFGSQEVWAASVVKFVVFLLLIISINRDSAPFYQQGTQSLFLSGTTAIWIPAVFFLSLILFQLVPLPASVLKIVSPATYDLYLDTGVWEIESGDGYQWRSISIHTQATFMMFLNMLAYWGIFFIVIHFKKKDFPGFAQAGNGRHDTIRSNNRKKGAVPVIAVFLGLIWTIFFLGLFNALFSFLQGASGGQIQWLRPLAPLGEYLGTFKSPNNFSEFLEMVIPLTMGLLIVRNYMDVKRFSHHLSTKYARIAALFSKTGFLSFGIIILISALYLSLCRGGFVTFPLTILLTLLFMVVSYRLHDRYSFFLFGLVVVGGVTYLTWLGIGPVIQEALTLLGPKLRPITYSDAIDIITDYPIFGVGFGCWQDIILKYHSMLGRETWVPAIAYNDTLQLTAETGLAGFLCMVAFLFMIYRKAITALRRGKDVIVQALILGGIAAMSAALIHSQFDYFFYLPSHAIVFMVIAGMTYRMSCETLNELEILTLKRWKVEIAEAGSHERAVPERP